MLHDARRAAAAAKPSPRARAHAGKPPPRSAARASRAAGRGRYAEGDAATAATSSAARGCPRTPPEPVGGFGRRPDLDLRDLGSGASNAGAARGPPAARTSSRASAPRARESSRACARLATAAAATTTTAVPSSPPPSSFRRAALAPARVGRGLGRAHARLSPRTWPPSPQPPRTLIVSARAERATRALVGGDARVGAPTGGPRSALPRPGLGGRAASPRMPNRRAARGPASPAMLLIRGVPLLEGCVCGFKVATRRLGVLRLIVGNGCPLAGARARRPRSRAAVAAAAAVVVVLSAAPAAGS